ncbi:MAG: Molybdenum cofactor biosynthesis protein B [Alphaproteobacteria bacterium MarineAlpha2_Bin1]|nr:MAG: Molybdenum cofactor biosynthesis protein B [Alphaproteobacteria bacterium MarineAlpha2_Bin1]
MSKKFVSCKICILTISDSRKEKNDESGDLLVEKLQQAGHKLYARSIVIDEIDEITKKLKIWVNDPEVNVIITTGGTGITKRDVTPEAIKLISDKIIEGFGELFRLISYQKIGTSTLQSRAIACISGNTYIFSVPGSPNACKDAWDEILKFQLDNRHRPCNFIELIPRLV